MGFFGRRVFAKCGHRTSRRGHINVFGERIEVTILIEDSQPDYCHQCLENMATKCPRCGEIIFVGDRVTHYTPADKDFKIPDYAIVINDNPLCLVSCINCNANKNIGDIRFWYPAKQQGGVLDKIIKLFYPM